MQISNIWEHPKTSVVGLLIAVVTIAGVFAQQGVTLGAAGKDTVVTLIAGVATALLGLLARDPEKTSSAAGSTTRLGALAMIMLLLMAPFEMGCSKTVAQDIVNWTPALQSAVSVVDSTAALLAPADALVFASITAGFDAASNVLVTEAKAYLANPTATALQQLQTAVTTLQQSVNAALLSAAKIVNPASQQKATTDINAVATVVNAILALVLSISSKAQIESMAVGAQVKLAAVEPLMRKDVSADMVRGHYDVSYAQASLMVDDTRMQLQAAGF